MSEYTIRGTTNLERQLRCWRAAACCLGALVAATFPIAAGLAQPDPAANGPLAAGQSPEIATLEIPAGVDVQVESSGLEHDPATDAISVRGKSTFTLSNGVRLRVRAGTVTAVPAGKPGPYRLLIRP